MLWESVNNMKQLVSNELLNKQTTIQEMSKAGYFDTC